MKDETQSQMNERFTLEDSESLPSPDLIAAEMVEDLESAPEQFSGIYERLGNR